MLSISAMVAIIRGCIMNVPVLRSMYRGYALLRVFLGTIVAYIIHDMTHDGKQIKRLGQTMNKWETLKSIHMALCETFSTGNKTKPAKRIDGCVDAVKRGERCEHTDCSVCDALETMNELMGG